MLLVFFRGCVVMGEEKNSIFFFSHHNTSSEKGTSGCGCAEHRCTSRCGCTCGGCAEHRRTRHRRTRCRCTCIWCTYSRCADHGGGRSGEVDDGHAVVFGERALLGEDLIALDQVPLQGVSARLDRGLEMEFAGLARVDGEVLHERERRTGNHGMALAVEPAIDDLDGVEALRWPGEVAGVGQGQVDRGV